VDIFRDRSEDVLVMVDGRRQEVVCFSLQRKKLFTLAKFPYFADGKAACVHMGDIFVSGGVSNILENRLVRFNTKRNRWDECCTMHEGRSYHTLVSVGDCLYSVSGFLTNDPVSSIECYSARDNAWIKVGDLAAPVGGIILFLLTAFVVYRRKNATPKKKTDTQKEATKTDSFIILSKLADVAISFNKKGEVIIERADKNNPNQQWIFTKANKQKEYFFIENVATHKVIEIANTDSNDGAKIMVNKKRSRKNDHQEWKLESSKERGFVFIVNRWAVNVLDVKYKKTKDGTKLQSFHKKVRGTENQEWKIEKL